MTGENSIDIISLGLWVICLFNGITTVVIYCELVLYETKKTFNILKEIRSVHKDMTDRIETYYLRLYHNKVKFTACGIFDVNFAFVNSLIAACSTYYVILLQFQVLDDTPSNGRNIF
ncbi:Gustatory receptor 43a [Carabus blaptoides fortunei]